MNKEYEDLTKVFLLLLSCANELTTKTYKYGTIIHNLTNIVNYYILIVEMYLYSFGEILKKLYIKTVKRNSLFSKLKN
ncbi:hypothetical protein JYG23_02770 [Sedimentibacter sp. zth1]|uniref:hypothetical protein n=1 Tax=Sedimentibacter sp. zth1 TaxID=2816908 RepID=UPI001A91002B|nr:hypothetical protein [Sedimentibacter sp. zth1]QSX06402.1 hypothetical protein JYG23_02770 [Sedimentibacter sp. zth1]